MDRDFYDKFCRYLFRKLEMSSNAASKYIKTQKTRDSPKIPILPQAQEILDRYEGMCPTALPTTSNQKANDYIKELGKLVEVDTPISIIRYQGAKRFEETFPKYEKLTTHTARKTFVTLALEKGMRPEVVMKITGHKDFKAMKPYIKIVDDVVGDEMFIAWGK